MRHIWLTCVAMLAATGTSFATTINVPADYTTIQEAVAAASNGDEILVAPGTYTGTGDEVVDMLGKAITLRSTDGAAVTIIDGQNARRGITCYLGETNATVIDGFTITNGNAVHGGGIYCNNSSPTITDCTILGNFAFNDNGGGGGIYCYESSPTITDCTISDNNSTYQGAGIACISSNPIITGCTISGNVGGYRGGGIWCWGGSPTITGCTISDNTASGTNSDGGGIRFDGSNGSPMLTDTLVCGNDPDQVFGYFVDGGENTILDQCTDLPGACCFNGSCSITTQAGCNGDWLGEGTDCSGNPCYVPPTGACCNGEDCSITTEAGCNGDWLGEGTDCSGNPCYVPPTGACCNGEDCSITTEAGCNGDWLGEGTDCSSNPCYVPPTGACCIGTSCSIETAVQCSGLGGKYLGDGTACSGNPCDSGPTSWTVDDDGPADFDNIQAAVDAASNTNVIVVQPGTYTGTGDEVVDTRGKAITILASGTPEETIIDGEGARRVVLCNSGEGAGTIIEGFTITGGSYYYGGGIHCSLSNPTISDCTISNNTSNRGGGIYCWGGSPTITDCTISNNTASEGGGGMHLYSSNLTLTDCLIADNIANSHGGGVYCTGGSSPALSGCTISNNTAYKGGGISCIYNSNPTLTGCTISGNMASDGGGIYCYSGTSATLADTLVCSNDPDQIFGNWTDNGGNTVSGECPICADVDGDGFVAVHDLLAVLEAWSSDDPDADVDGDGLVGMGDLVAVIANWGPCP